VPLLKLILPFSITRFPEFLIVGEELDVKVDDMVYPAKLILIFCPSSIIILLEASEIVIFFNNVISVCAVPVHAAIAVFISAYPTSPYFYNIIC